jgi:hypothetical protein
VGSNLTEGGGFFPRKEPPPCVCVCLSGADGRVVEGRADTLPTPPRGRQGSNPGRMGHPWMLCRPERRKEKGVGGRGKYPEAPAPPKKKQTDRKVSDKPEW